MERTVVGFRSIRDAEVRAGTGKGWQEWCELIESAQIKTSVSSITQYLCSTHKLITPWAQIVAVYYKWHV